MAIDDLATTWGKLTALNDNLQLWVAIRTLAEHEVFPVPEVR